MILEESEKLYNNLTIRLTNDIIAAVAAMKTISLPLSLPSSNNNSQKLKYENDTYQTEEARCNNNNQPQIYNGNQEQANE